MSGHQTADINDTVFFWFASNDTSGSGDDGATALFYVREGGAAAGAIPLLSGSPTLLSHANFPAGCYEIAVAATTGNGFAANDVFSVFCTLAVDSQNPSGFVGSCRLTPIATQASVDAIPTTAMRGTDNAALASVATEARLAELDPANLPADIDAIPTTAMRGTDNAATAVNLATAQADLDIITDVDGVIIGAAGIDLVWDEVLTGGTHNVNNSSGKRLRALGGSVLHDGTMQAGSTSSTAIFDTGASTIDDFYNHAKVLITGGTGQEQEAIISDYVGSTRVATITPSWRTTPDDTSEFQVSPGVAHAATIAGGYEGGAIWVDTLSGVSGTQLYVNGVIDNPVDNIADARILADALNMRVFHSIPGSSFTLAQTFNNFEFIGVGYTINMGSQDISGCRFIGAAITGIGTGSVRSVFRECILPAGATLPVCTLLNCNLASSTFVLSAASTYNFNNCIANLAVLDFGAAVGNTVVNMHLFSGQIQMENMNDSGTDDIVVDGFGEFIEGTCTGGTARLTGNMSTSGITNITVTEPARLDLAAINAEAKDVLFTDTDAEPGQGAPGVAVSLSAKIGFLYKAWRNRSSQDATDYLLYNDDASTVDQKATVSDDTTTAEKGEVVTGP